MRREEWVDILGFPSHMVSNFGRVCNWRSGIVLKPNTSEWGYRYVVLYRRGRTFTKYIHRLVAENFVPGQDDDLEANHIDGDKENNHEDNLEWVTKSMNNQHALVTGLRSPRATPVKIVELDADFPTVKACAEFLGTYPTVVSEVLNGRRPHYKGYTFQRLS